MNKIRLGLIGCGWVSKFYGDASRNLSDRCEWAWAADTNLASTEKFCSAYGGKPLADFRGAKADALIIALPHHLHVPVYLEVAPNGVPVLKEKPLALSVEEVDRIIAARDKARGVLMVGYVSRYRRGPRALKAALDAGRIGEPLFCEASQYCTIEGYVTGWLAKKAAGGAPWQTLRVFGTAGSLLMTYAPQGLLIEGDKVAWDTKLLLLRDAQPDETLLQHTGPFDFAGQLEHFLECIEQGKQPLTTAEQARDMIAATRTAEATLTS
jgi:predicted dehydrogenase